MIAVSAHTIAAIDSFSVIARQGTWNTAGGAGQGPGGSEGDCMRHRWIVATLVLLTSMLAGGGNTVIDTASPPIGRQPGAPAFAAGAMPAAAPAVDPANPKNFFFHGTPPSDDPSKFTGPPYTATFDDQAPDGTQGTSQTMTAFADPEFAGSAYANFWYAPFNGNLDDDFEFRWYWSSTNATAIAVGAEVTIQFWADPDLNAGTGTKIGEAVARLVVAPQPTLNVNRVTVKGNVLHNLMIQVVSNFGDTGEAITANYDSTDTPSSFSYPAPPAPTGPNVAFAKDNPVTFAPATIASAHFMAGEPQITMERPVAGS